MLDKEKTDEEMQSQGNLVQGQWEGGSQTWVLQEDFHAGGINPRVPRSLDRELELAIRRQQEGKAPQTLQSAGIDTASLCW